MDRQTDNDFHSTKHNNLMMSITQSKQKYCTVKVTVRYLKGTSTVPQRYLEGTARVPQRYLEGTATVPQKYLKYCYGTSTVLRRYWGIP